MNTTGDNLQAFKNLIGIKFEMYNSLFASLPFHRVERTGVMLSLFLLNCEEGFGKERSPTDIVTSFLEQYTSLKTEQEQVDFLFRFVQYAERQVVLFDSLEDAAFRQVHDMNGLGTLKNLKVEVADAEKEEQLAEKLKDFSVRLVLTAHPTQFYPSSVLGIINDLSKVLTNDNAVLANTYLQQLGKTPFFKKEKPTPFDEAVSLIWFLENVFYQAAGHIITQLKMQFPQSIFSSNHLIRMGFWPGGDRDGNPFVTSDITLKVAGELRGSIIKCYYMDVRRLKRRLTFKGVENVLAALEIKLYNNLFVPGYEGHLSKDEIITTLNKIKETLLKHHNGLFLGMLTGLINKVELFGLFFTSLDIRQDSSVHAQLLEAIAEKTTALPKKYKELSDDKKIDVLLNLTGKAEPEEIDNELQKDTLLTIDAIKHIQLFNGEEGCHRYIISHSTSAINVIEVYALFLLRGWKKEELSVDIVPLFETIDDLQHSAQVMKTLYENRIYREHLKRRNNTQTIMLGFSDGTKDGGYLMANWGIYKAKEELSFISKEYDVEVIFFDGRGGPPARGGGKTHQFYASMGKNISNREIQLTVQGQTISSNFGNVDSAQYNMERLIHAGIHNALFSVKERTLTPDEEELLKSLADESYEAYSALKADPNFIDYLSSVSPLRYYAETNIASRPSKRNAGKLNLNDLRAVPYVGSWSQIKQNLPGYYGVGAAFEKLEAQGRWKEVKALYENSLFFRTLLDNCEMAMNKCFFPLTSFLAHHQRYGKLWNMIYDEYERTKKYLLLLTGEKELMADKPIDKLSIQMRQRIELPLVTIQQYALTKIREMEEDGLDTTSKHMYEKLAMRCSFGIINAERNSA